MLEGERTSVDLYEGTSERECITHPIVRLTKLIKNNIEY